MSLLVTIILILMGSTFIVIICNKKIEETIIFYMLSTIILIYLFGLFGYLKLGVYAFITISIVLFLSSLILYFKNKDKKKIIRNIITPGLLLFLIMNVVIWYFERGRMFLSWDEFSHWGSSIKSMFYINDFATSPKADLMFQSYPPAMTIFQYMFMVIKGDFIEYYAYFSYCIFCISLILPFTKNLKWNNIIKIIFYFFIILLVPTLIANNFYSCIYIDTALGLTFGFIVSYIISKKEKYSKFDIILICMSFIILILQKDTGLFLALIAFLIFAIDILFFKNKVKIKKENIRKILKNTIIIALPILAILFAKLSWKYSITVNHATVMFSGKYDIKEIIQILLGNNTTYRMTVLQNFVSACFTEIIFKNIISLNCIQLGIAFSIVFVIISKICKSNKRENTFFTIVILGLVTYLFGLMITYMYKFHETEALALASFARYLKIYFTGIVFIFSTVLINKANIDNKTIIIFTLILAMFSPLGEIKDLRKTAYSSINKRNLYVEEANKIKSVVKPEEKLYFIDIQNPDMGYRHWIQKLNLKPINVTTKLGFNITAFEEKSTSYLDYVPPEKLNQLLLNEYDYVYISGVDENFKLGYSSLFDNITENSLYKINNNKIEKIY